jgi:Tfp pilus assembly protein PilV
MKKLRSRAGETLTETLVALLISVLALLMLAGAVTSATRVITRSKDKMTQYYAADAGLANRTAAGSSLNVELEDNADSSLSLSIPVQTYENNAFASRPVIAYAETGGAP